MANADSTASNDTPSETIEYFDFTCGLARDIWTINSQTIATLALADLIDDDEAEEPPAIRAMLRDIKTKMEVLALKVDNSSQQYTSVVEVSSMM
jgi:hypothetical protein